MKTEKFIFRNNNNCNYNFASNFASAEQWKCDFCRWFVVQPFNLFYAVIYINRDTNWIQSANGEMLSVRTQYTLEIVWACEVMHIIHRVYYPIIGIWKYINRIAQPLRHFNWMEWNRWKLAVVRIRQSHIIYMNSTKLIKTHARALSKSKLTSRRTAFGAHCTISIQLHAFADEQSNYHEMSKRIVGIRVFQLAFAFEEHLIKIHF